MQRLMGAVGGGGRFGSEVFDEQEEEEDAAGFVAPRGQTGDGRTTLNDKLGY